MKRRAVVVLMLAAVLLTACGGQEAAKGLKTFTEPGTLNGEAVSTKKGESAVLVKDGGAVFVNNAEISRRYSGKAGKVETAGVFVLSGKAVVNNSNLKTEAEGASGILVADEGELEFADSALATAGEKSPGLSARGKGGIYAWDNIVGTTGSESPALLMETGEGSMILDGGTFTATGEQSPAIRAAGKAWIHGATLTAGNAEALSLTDGAALSLYDCNLAGNMPAPGGNQKNAAILLRRAQETDGTAGAIQLLLSGGTVRAQQGHMFYADGADATVIVKDSTLALDAERSDLFRASNGAKSRFIVYGQRMEGRIGTDEDASIKLYLRDISKFTGDIVAEAGPGNAEAPGTTLCIDGTSIWVVTGDSKLRALYAEGLVKDTEGLDVTIQGEDGTVFRKGDSRYTVTVTGEYRTSADFSGIPTADEFSAHAAERPEKLR